MNFAGRTTHSTGALSWGGFIFYNSNRMKKIIALALCVVFAWGAVALWNWAEPFGELTDTNAQLFDFFAAIAIFVSMGCATWYTQLKKNGKAKANR